MKNLWFGNIQLNSGETLQGDRIGELTTFIINKQEKRSGLWGQDTEQIRIISNAL